MKTLKLHPFIIVGIAVCAMLLLAYAQQTQHQAPPQTTTAATEPAPPIVGLLPPISSIETRYDAARIAEYDLQAQRWMAWFTGLLALLTFAGVILIAMTLRETGLVLAEARKTTQAAEASIAVQRQASIQQTRAYLSVDLARIFVKQSIFVLKLSIHNSGNTPANDIFITNLAITQSVSPYAEGIRHTIVHYTDDDIPAPFGALGAQRGKEASWKCPFREKDFEDLAGASEGSLVNTMIAIHIVLSYSDVFKKVHEVAYVYIGKLSISSELKLMNAKAESPASVKRMIRGLLKIKGTQRSQEMFDI